MRPEVNCKANISKQKAIVTDEACLVITGPKTTLQGIVRVLQFQKVVLSENENASVDTPVERSFMFASKVMVFGHH